MKILYDNKGKIKILKACNNKCEYFNCHHVEGNQYRYRCFNPLARRKNGSFRIFNHNMLLRRKLPDWCPLEDHRNANN